MFEGITMFSALTHHYLNCFKAYCGYKFMFPPKNKKMLSKQEIGLHSAPLKRGVLKAQETKLTWANKNKVIIEFLTMGKQNLTVEVTSKLSI